MGVPAEVSHCFHIFVFLFQRVKVDLALRLLEHTGDLLNLLIGGRPHMVFPQDLSDLPGAEPDHSDQNRDDHFVEYSAFLLLFLVLVCPHDSVPLSFLIVSQKIFHFTLLRIKFPVSQILNPWS